MRTAKISELIENFGLFDDWEERYGYLIELAKGLPAFDPAFQTEEFNVKGCVSQVWMVPKPEKGVFHFTATSDAILVKGLIAVLYQAYDGVKLEDLEKVDIDAIFSEIGLDQNLSPNRRNGFFAMVKRIQGFGTASVDGPSAEVS